MKLRTRSRFLFNRSKKAKARRSRDPSRIDPSRTFALRKAFANKVKLAFAKLKGAVFKLVAVEDAFGLKDRQAVKNVAAEETSFDVPVSVPISPPPPFRLIEVPDVRQRDHFSCGAASANSVGLHFGVGPKTLEAWKKLLGTDVEESTHPQAIVKAFADLGLSVSARSGMTVEDLARLTSRGAPVICPVQDYGPFVPKKARFAYGHYLTVIGVAAGYVFCQDSSEDNVIADSGSAQDPGRIMISAMDWDQIWHDEDADKNKYVRFGIAVSDDPLALIPDRPPGVPADAAWQEEFPGGPSQWVDADGWAYKCWNPEFTDSTGDGTEVERQGETTSRSPAFNAFCPTGEGGGVDPSCSLSSSSHFGKWKHPPSGKYTSYVGYFEQAASDLEEQGYQVSLDSAVTTHSMYLEATHSDGRTVRVRVSDHSAAGGKSKGAPISVVEGNSIITGKPFRDVQIYGHRAGKERTKQAILDSAKPLIINALTSNTRWKFNTTSEQVEAFKTWLRQQLQATVRGMTMDELWRKYVIEGYKKGAGRAFDESKVAERALAEQSKEKLDFYDGTREQFLESAFGRPVSIDRVKQLAGRVFTELDGVTSQMSTKMSRVLLDGLVQGRGPRDVARDLAKEVDIGRERALLISRTELIRAHAEGALDGYDELGIEEVGAAVEFSNTEDDKVCPDCEALEGVVLQIDEARGVIPVHPG